MKRRIVASRSGEGAGHPAGVVRDVIGATRCVGGEDHVLEPGAPGGALRLGLVADRQDRVHQRQEAAALRRIVVPIVDKGVDGLGRSDVVPPQGADVDCVARL